MSKGIQNKLQNIYVDCNSKILRGGVVIIGALDEK